MSLRSHVVLFTVALFAPLLAAPYTDRLLAKPFAAEDPPKRLEGPIEVEVFSFLQGGGVPAHPAMATAASELRSRAARTGRFDVKRHPLAQSIWGREVDRSTEARPPHALVVEIQYLIIGTLEESVSLLAPDAQSRLGPIIGQCGGQAFVNCGVKIDLVERHADGSSRTTCTGFSYVSVSFPEHTCDVAGIRDCLLVSQQAGGEQDADDPGSNVSRLVDLTAGACSGAWLHKAVTDPVSGALEDLLACLDNEMEDSGLGPVPFARYPKDRRGGSTKAHSGSSCHD